MLTKLALACLLVARALAGDMTISTPASLIECQPVQLKWDGGKAPYFLAAIPGGQPSAPALKDFGEQTGTSLTWTVDLPAGTSISLRLTDSAGVINYNQAVTIQAGSGGKCAGAGAAAAAVSPSAASMANPSMSMSMGMSASESGMSASMASAPAPSMSMSAMSMSGSAMGMASSSSMVSMPSGSMSMSGMSRSSSMMRSSVSTAPARASSASPSESSNSALTTQQIVSGGMLGFLLTVFAAIWA